MEFGSAGLCSQSENHWKYGEMENVNVRLKYLIVIIIFLFIFSLKSLKKNVLKNT